MDDLGVCGLERVMRWPEKIGEAIEAIQQAPFLTETQDSRQESAR